MDLIGFLLGFGLLQGVILALVLMAARSGHRQANAIMAALVASIALYLLQRWLVRIGFWLDHPDMAFVLWPIKFIWGPLLYLYTVSLTGGRFNKYPQLHFVPAMLMFLYINIPFWQISSDQQKELLNYLSSVRNDPVQKELIFGFLNSYTRFLIETGLQSFIFTPQLAVYCVLVLVQIKKHNQHLEQHYSSLEAMNLRWLRLLIMTCLIYLGIYLLFNRLPFLLFEDFDRFTPAASASALVLVILIYGIALSGLFQPSLISGVLQARDNEQEGDSVPSGDSPASGESTQRPVEKADMATINAEKSDAPDEGNGKYLRSGLSMSDAQRFKMKLMAAMQDQELYLNCDLTLPDLAEATGLSAHQISQVINGQMNENFFSFVNSYRIELARRMLLDPKTAGMPIVELAIEVGFKSKSSFYDAFKRTTDMTPTQYKKTRAESCESEA